VSLILFSGSSFLLIDYTPKIEETDQAIAQVFKHKYVVSNTYDEDVSFIFINDGRLYSADGNLNWRFQLWQDILENYIKNNEVFFGHGFNDRIPIFENIWYSGLDGSNENSHNYLINVYIRVGLVGLLIVIYFFYRILKLDKNNFSKSEFLRFLLPLIFISLFDGSMENPYFASTFYFFTGSFFSGIKLYQQKNNLDYKKL
jgi:O-antigen ligase